MHQHLHIRLAVRAAIVVAAAAGLSACDVMVNTMHGGGREKAERTWTRSYALDAAGAAVDIVNVNGEIKVEAVEGSTLEVTAVITARGATPEDAKKTLDQVEMAEEAGAKAVRVQAKYPRELGRHGIEVAYTIRAPKSARLGLETVNGHVHLNGAFAGVKAETTNGSVHGDGLGNTVVATTTNGEIKVRMDSRRCRFIPGDRDECPGNTGECGHLRRPDECRDAGGTVVTVRLPIARAVEPGSDGQGRA